MKVSKTSRLNNPQLYILEKNILRFFTEATYDYMRSFGHFMALLNTLFSFRLYI